MKIPDHKLRTDRIVFYAKEMEELDSELDSFLELSGARCALLIDRERHMVTRRGETVAGSLESLSALIAGSFAATREVASILGEEEFSTLFHQGARNSIQLSLLGPRTLLGIVWDDRTNLGLVRFYAQETTKRLEEILKAARERPASENDEGLGEDYSQEAAAALDDLF